MDFMKVLEQTVREITRDVNFKVLKVLEIQKKRKRQTKTIASKDRLSALPESILHEILSLLPERKEIVRSSILSKRWRFLWKSVPLSLVFHTESRSEEGISGFLYSITRELQYWRCCQNIRTIKFCLSFYVEECVRDIDLLVHFATKVANIEGFSLTFAYPNIRSLDTDYEFPQYAYDNSSWKNLELDYCVLNPLGSVNWSHLLSLSLCNLTLTEVVMKKVLSGCPNLECLEIERFSGIYHLEINSKKLRTLILRSLSADERLEILAPYVQYLELYGGLFFMLRNGESLVTVDLDVEPELAVGHGDEEYKWKKMCSYFNELLQSVAHVENVELGYWSIQFLSGMELKGLQSPPSNWKSLKLTLALEQVNFSGICNILRGSLDLETLDINFYHCYDEDAIIISDFTNEDDESRWFESYSLTGSLPHLKTIKIYQFNGPLPANGVLLPLVEYLLKNANVLEKLFISDIYKGSDVSKYYEEMEEELLSFPRSSPNASVFLKYG